MRKFLVALFLLVTAFVSLFGCSIDAHINTSASESPSLPQPSLPSVPVIKKATVKQIVSGEYGNCVLLSDSRVKCWGVNWSGQLGVGDTLDRGDEPDEMGENLPAVDLGMGRKAVQLAAGRYHICALLDNGKVKCWGEGWSGELGLGLMGERGGNPGDMGDNLPYVDLGTGPTVAQIVAGGFHTCVLFSNGKIKCWGSGGPLGSGNPNDIGDDPNEMGDNLPYVDLGVGRTVVKIAGGDGHNCAILDNARVKCWGSNSSGQLGLGNKTSYGSVPGQMGDSLPYVDLGTGRTAVDISTTTGDHTCVILDNGTMKCWGYNGAGELGIGASGHRGDDANEMGDNLPSVNLGLGRKAIKIVTGRNRTCVLLDNSELKCWGWNSRGALGLGDLDGRGAASGDMGDNLPAIQLGTGLSVVQMSCGWTHTCALFNNGQMKCWGDNTYGMLGLGDKTNRGGDSSEMGDNLATLDFGNEVP